MSERHHLDLVRALADPRSYPHRPAAVDMVQTHISVVFLAGERVYKIKKPVRFSFLDFSTLERRRRFCHEEVRLNRRLAPDIYEGVAGIEWRDGQVRFVPEPADQAAEYAVVMRRLPADSFLDRMVAEGRADDDHMDRLAEVLACFHAAADAGDEVTANGSVAAVRRIMEDNFAGIAPFRGATADPGDDDAVRAFIRGFLDHRGELFRRRCTERRIRDGHGDLHCDHVFFLDRPMAYDCIEFEPRLRHCDVASDIAFLAMDLTYLGRPDLASRFVASYIERSGDSDIPALLPFYLCYRAYVRGKVDSLKSAEEEVPEEERTAAREGARRHFELAYRTTWSGRPAVVVVCGLSGTGKSTVAERLHRRTGFAWLNSDRIRKELTGLAPTERPRPDQSIYTPEISTRTYDTIFDRARQALAAGDGAILDATFQLRRGRATARDIAADYGVPYLCVECTCPEPEIRRRLDTRTAAGTDPSDADWEVYVQQRRHHEPLGPDEDPLVIDTTASAAAAARRIEQRLRELHGA